MQVDYSVGLDIGWKNAGVAVVARTSNGIELVHCATLNPSGMNAGKRCTQILSEVGSKVTPTDVNWFVAERYVAYQGVQTAESENILMLLGGVVESSRHIFYNADIMMLRAIEWKTELVKLLFKLKGFQNPSDKLDKKFSVAAAHACLDIDKEIPDDHCADAICMASLPFLREALALKTKLARETTKALS